MSGEAFNAASRILQTLPAQFLALVVLNTAFLGGLLWFLNNVDDRRVKAETTVSEARERMLTPLIASCLKTVPLEALPGLQQPAKP